MVKNTGAGAALTMKSTGAPVLFPGVPDSAAMIPSYTLPAPNLNNGSGAGTGFTAQTSLLFFDNDGNSRPDHMGILSSYSDGSISVIEGNSSGMCAENTYSSHDKRIISYGAF